MKTKILIGMALLLVNLPVFGQTLQNSADKELESWILKNSVPMDSIDEMATTVKLANLDSKTQNMRLLFLGEPDHYITEKLEYQLALIKRYFRKGFTTIGIEMGRSDARRINRYLKTGDEKILDSVALFGNLSEVRTDRDLPKGLLAGKGSNLESAKSHQNFIEGNKQFWRKLRGLKGLEVFGFDVDVLIGGAYADINHLIEGKVSSEISHLKSLLIRVPNESRNDEVSRLMTLKEILNSEAKQFVNLLGNDIFEDIVSSLRQLIESYAFIDVAYNNPTSDQWLKIAAQREHTMMWQLDEQLKRHQKIILLGHNSHLAKDSNSLNFESVQSGSFFPSWYTIGTYLFEKLHGQIFGIWMLYGGGTRSSGPECSMLECHIDLNPESINQNLSKASMGNPRFIVFPEFEEVSGSLRKPVNFQFNGSVINSTILPRQTDAILFLPTVHATCPF